MNSLFLSSKVKGLLFLLLNLLFFSDLLSQNNYETFRYSDYSLPDLGMTANDANWGSKIFTDSKKNIWIYGFMSLQKYSGLNITKSDCENHLMKKLTSSICEDKAGNILVGSNGTLYIYDGKGWSEKKVKGNITAMCCDSEGIVWLSCRGLLAGSTLFKYNGQEFIKVAAIDGVVISINAESTDLLLSIQHYTATAMQFYNCDDIYSLSKATGKYKEIFDTIDRTKYSLSVTSGYIDRNGNRWFGTKILGTLTQIRNPCLISSTDNENCIVYSKENGLGTGNMITSICQDDNNNIWVGTLNGLYKYANNNWMSYSLNEGLIDNIVVGLVSDQGLLYVYTGKALTIIKNL